jgi:transposase
MERLLIERRNLSIIPSLPVVWNQDILIPSIQPFQEVMVETKRLDYLGIVAGVCKEIGLVELIDELIPSERKVSVGEATLAMILNGLGFSNRRLYLTEQFCETKPVDMLIREELKAEDFNDDSLGRALDKLYEYGVTELFSQ